MLGVKVYDAMSSDAKYISPHSTIQNAVKVMIKEKVGSLVCYENDKIKGILTESDIIKKVINEERDPKTLLVSQVMSKKVISVHPNEDLEKATKLMAKKRYKRLPVVENKRLVGMLTVKDVLKIEPLLIEVLVEKLKIVKRGFFKHDRIEGFCDNCKKHTKNLIFVDGKLYCENCR